MNVPSVGLLTKTASYSTTVQWIIPLYSRTYGLVQAHISEDRVILYGNIYTDELRAIGSRDDFSPGRIRAAKALSLSASYHGIALKSEDGNLRSTQPDDSLVLTLDTNLLVLLKLGTDAHGRLKLSLVEARPLPITGNPLSAYSSCLATTDRSGAIAAVSPDGNMMLFQTAREDGDKLHVSQPSFTQMASHILGLTLVETPTTQDARHTTIIAVTCARGKVHLDVADSSTSGAGQMIPRFHQRLDLDGAFAELVSIVDGGRLMIIATSRAVYVYTKILAGYATRSILRLPDTDLLDLDETDVAVWTACVPLHRSDSTVKVDGEERLLVRSNGTVVGLHLRQPNGKDMEAEVAWVSSLAMPVDQSVVYYESMDGRRFIVAYGDRAEGGVYQVDWHGSVMLIQTLPNRSPSLDLIATTLPRARDASVRSADSLFATAGRGKDGRIAQLRPGFDARILFSFDLEGAERVVDLWPIADHTSRNPMLLHTLKGAGGEGGTQVVTLSDEGITMIDQSTVESDMPSPSTLPDLHGITLAITQDKDTGALIQITDQAVSISTTSKNDKLYEAPPGSRIVKGSICTASRKAATVEHPEDEAKTMVIVDLDEEPAPDSRRAGELKQDVVVVEILHFDTGDYLATSTGDGTLEILSSEDCSLLCGHSFSRSAATPIICDHILSTSMGDLTDTKLLICPLRNGHIEILRFIPASDQPLVLMQSLSVGSTHVRVTPYSDKSGSAASTVSVIAACGSSLYMLTANIKARRPRFEIHPLYLTDPQLPSLEHVDVSAIAQIQQEVTFSDVSLLGALVVIMGSSCFVALVDCGIQAGIVPRSLSIKGDPVRMLWSSQMRHFIVGGVEESLSTGTGSGKSFRSVIEFRLPTEAQQPEDGDSLDSNTRFLLRASERIFAMAEWVYLDEDNRKYLFVIVATGLEGRDQPGADGQPRSQGRLLVLQPTLHSGRIEDVKLAKQEKLSDPVYCVTQYDPLTFVFGSGVWLYMWSYLPSTRKWSITTRHRLTSPAVHVTCSAPYVQITTARDSLVTFRVEDAAPTSPGPEQHVMRLVRTGTDTAAALGQHHISLPAPLRSHRDQSMTIMATKTGHVRGFLTSAAAKPSPAVSALTTVFSASLPRVLTRLVSANVSLDPLQREMAMFGTSIDGAVVGLQVLPPQEWAVLKWVELLCRRSSVLCPFERSNVVFRRNEDDWHGQWKGCMGLMGLRPYAGESAVEFEGRTGATREVVEGMGKTTSEKERVGDAEEEDEMDGVEYEDRPARPLRREKVEQGDDWEEFNWLARSERWKDEDMHVDGDLLGRLLRAEEVNGDAEEMLTNVLQQEAQNKTDKIGTFVREHLEAELALVDETVDLVWKRMHGWGFW